MSIITWRINERPAHERPTKRASHPVQRHRRLAAASSMSSSSSMACLRCGARCGTRCGICCGTCSCCGPSCGFVGDEEDKEDEEDMEEAAAKRRCRWTGWDALLVGLSCCSRGSAVSEDSVGSLMLIVPPPVPRSMSCDPSSGHSNTLSVAGCGSTWSIKPPCPAPPCPAPPCPVPPGSSGPAVCLSMAASAGTAIGGIGRVMGGG